MNKRQIAIGYIIFVLGLALIPLSVYMINTDVISESFFVDILGSNRLTHDTMRNIDIENMPDNPSMALDNIVEEQSLQHNAKISEEETPTYILDPTGKRTRYLLNDYTEEIFELRGSRGQTSRHFYNKATRRYTYQSDNLVQKEGVYEDTNWVTAEEYPQRFLLRHRNGEIKFFETASEISTYLTQIDKTSIWAVGFESFSGVMGFYLNFQDADWGHAQYLYWPRLENGQISAYNQSLYAIYPRLFTKTNGIWFDQILTDRTLYSESDQNPSNTLAFYNSDGKFGMSYSLGEITIQETTWNFKHGFKYCLEDQKYHMITEFDCVDQDFEDIGLAYEITRSPQSDNTPYKPVKFILHNDIEEVALSAEEAWQAEQYLENYYSKVHIVSENDMSFCFTFDDMELAGFTEKYLKLHDRLMPDGSVRKVLCAGMYGLGEYITGTKINIDPDVSVVSTDTYDLYRESTTWKTQATYMYVGDKSSMYQTCFVAFNTGITQNIADIYSVLLQMYCEASTFDSSNEGANCYVYNVKGNVNPNTAKENSLGYSLGTYDSEYKVYSGNIGTGGYKTADGTKMGTLLNFWADERNSDENWISMYFSPYSAESNDYYKFTESTGSNAPKLSFDYDPKIVKIDGYVKESGTSNAIAGAHVELYLGGEKLNGSTTSGSGYYSFWVNDSNDQHTLWAWHEDYVKQSKSITPNTHRTESFYLNSETIPSQSPPYGCKSPTTFSEDDSTGWTRETQAYSLGTNYAVGEKSWKNIYYKNYGWNVPSDVTIQGVYVYIHWKPVLDDELGIKLYWNGGSSSLKFKSTSNWALQAINFTDATTWNAVKINSNFKVMIQKVTNGGAEDKVIIDWVGTLVEYTKLRIASTCVSNNPEKGDDVEFSIKIDNLGTVAATDVETKLKVKGGTYNWNKYVCDYLNWDDDSSLDAGETETHSVTIDKFFVCDAGRFAWNAGNYKIDRVDAQCTESETDSNLTDISFTVEESSSNICLIFAVVYFDAEFEAINYVSSVSDFFYGAVSHKMKLNDFDFETSTESTIAIYNNGFEEMMNVSYDCLFRPGWDPDSSWTTGEMMEDLRTNHSISDLELSGNWTRMGSGEYATSSKNHGFDILVGLSGTGDNSEAHGLACGSIIQVNIDPYVINPPYFTWTLEYAQLVTVHELSHTFGAEDWYLENQTAPIFCVMNHGELHNDYISAWWFVHWTANVYYEMTKSFRG